MCSLTNPVGGLSIVLLLMLGESEFSVRGILTLDSITDYDLVFKQIRERGHQISERIEIINSEQEDDI
jgi:hypothetical protein